MNVACPTLNIELVIVKLSNDVQSVNEHAPKLIIVGKVTDFKDEQPSKHESDISVILEDDKFTYESASHPEKAPSSHIEIESGKSRLFRALQLRKQYCPIKLNAFGRTTDCKLKQHANVLSSIRFNDSGSVILLSLSAE